MSVQASVVLITARTFLNDDINNLWTDNTLLPKLAQAHRELQVKLRSSGAPVTRAIVSDQPVAANATGLSAPIADLIEPLTLWEKAPGGLQSDYLLMTEADPLPVVTADSALHWWQWYQESIRFNPCILDRVVRVRYTRAIPVPVASTDLIGFLNGELYLAPRTAAIAAGSVGQKDLMTWATELAHGTLDEIILTNKGRLKPAGGSTARP